MKKSIIQYLLIRIEPFILCIPLDLIARQKIISRFSSLQDIHECIEMDFCFIVNERYNFVKTARRERFQ